MRVYTHVQQQRRCWLHRWLRLIGFAGRDFKPMKADLCSSPASSDLSVVNKAIGSPRQIQLMPRLTF